jgi:hypothetical protein
MTQQISPTGSLWKTQDGTNYLIFGEPLEPKNADTGYDVEIGEEDDAVMLVTKDGRVKTAIHGCDLYWEAYYGKSRRLA